MTGKELQAIYSGIGHELKFWHRFVQSDQFKSWLAAGVTPELSPLVANFIGNNTTGNSKVLDVGSGVVSILNGQIAQKNLVATDPLGELYECIFDYRRHFINPPLAIAGEALDVEDEFDIVHMRNALDHSQNPLKVLHRLVAACKKGGYVIVQGFENEAYAENWQGFHQWNISSGKNGLDIAGREEEFNTADTIPAAKLVYNLSEPVGNNGKTWFTWIIQK